MKYILNLPIILTLCACAPLGEHFQTLKSELHNPLKEGQDR